MNLENPDNHSVNPDEMSLRDLILKGKEWTRYLISYWIIIVIIGLIGGVLGFLYAKSEKPIYSAITTFVLEDGGGGGGMGQYAGIASMVGIDVGGGNNGLFQGDNILQLYKSRSMIQNALLSPINDNGKKKLLIDKFIEAYKLRQTWREKPELRNISFADSAHFTRKQDSIIGEMVRNINTSVLSVSKPDKKLSIIKVLVKSKDEVFAKLFNDRIVATVNDFYVKTKTKKSLENVNILEQKTDSVRSVMNRSIYSAATTMDATPNLNITRQILRAPIQKTQFNAEASKKILEELMKNLELSKITLRKESPLLQVVDSPIYPLEVEKFSKLKGLVVGGFLAGFLVCLVLIIRRIIKSF